MAFNWTCPHCDRDQSVSDGHFKAYHRHLDFADLAQGTIGVRTDNYACANPLCRKLTTRVRVGPDHVQYNNWTIDNSKDMLFDEFVLPRGAAKPQPDFIPSPLREDYAEACLIRDISPKAAATLVRRCLQGMIRDFCKISKKTLFDEIKALREAVDANTAPAGVTPESVEAIDAVRGVGNIGAHMEADINLIVDVDPDEAQTLIELVEMLFSEWYVAQHKRDERLAAIKKLAEQKKAAIAEGKAAVQAAIAAPPLKLPSPEE